MNKITFTVERVRIIGGGLSYYVYVWAKDVNFNQSSGHSYTYLNQGRELLPLWRISKNEKFRERLSNILIDKFLNRENNSQIVDVELNVSDRNLHKYNLRKDLAG